MLISTLDELRLYSPANAIDRIDTIQGFLDSSEQDFLLEKLGQNLYDSLCDYYRSLRSDKEIDRIAEFIEKINNGDELTPYQRLLTLAQRVIAFDALGRAVDMQAISVNGAGVNVASADDYAKADSTAIQNYKNTCVKEAHAAINRMLVVLEQWAQEVDVSKKETPTNDDSKPSSENEDGSASVVSADADKVVIVGYWKRSRYYYLAASLLIPSATILQDYLNIYDSREKFIQMLPDLRYIQEDVLAPAIGEDLLDYIVKISQSNAVTTDSFPDGTPDSQQRLILRIIHKARKAMARLLESRTMQFRIADQRRETARTEGTRLVTDLCEFITVHYKDLPEDGLAAFKLSPLYKQVADDDADDEKPLFENNAEGSVMFITPAI